jgi:hypothetical protein
MVEADFRVILFYMKYLFVLFLLISFSTFGQPIKSGTYIFKYCDIEYNKCLSTCKVVIKGYSITVYATEELSESITGIKIGDILEKGTLVKNKKGNWTIKNKEKIKVTEEEFLYIDFKKREVWRF